VKIGLISVLTDQSPAIARRYAAIRDLALQAESEGFDSLWIYDHLIYRLPGKPTEGVWEGWTILSALAEATTRIGLGTLVMCTQFRNPALLAKMADTLDEVSNGRLILGLGAGWHEPEFQAFGYPTDHWVGRFEEALQIICPLLRTGRVDFHGTYYEAPDCELAPRGPRPNGLPILIGGKNPRMLRLAASYADMWNTARLGGSEGLRARKNTIEQACREVGRDPTTLGLTVEIDVAYPDLDASGVSAENHHIGSTAEIAAVLADFERLGVGHVQVGLAPTTSAAIVRFAEAMRLYRGSRSSE
jgi:alkanesulfonate monooxygenase SsuD/methylene tetrahydromethanopterin reductase-like flavin-dependent oxidoreductase (luciferase family)